MPAAAIVLVYFLIWPVVRPNGPLSPATFLPLGGYGGLAIFAVVVLAVAAGCGAVMAKTRPEGAMLAAAFGAGGISLNSEQIRVVLWSRQGDVGVLLGQMILEVMVLAAVAALAAIVITAVRKGLASINKRLVWQDPVGDRSNPQGTSAKGSKGQQPRSSLAKLSPLLHEIVSGSRSKALRPHADCRGLGRMIVARCAAFMGLGLVVAVALLALTLRSPERGQILFALVASFAIGALAAQEFFPVPYRIIAWMMPMLAAVLLYAYAWTSQAAAVASDWSLMPIYARALPVDWMAAGGGGALLGYWISARMHVQRHMEHQQQNTQGD